MTERISLSENSTDPCPLCGASVQNSSYPRHRMILEDESEVDTDRHAERRLCSDCWERLHEKLIQPELVTNDRENSVL